MARRKPHRRPYDPEIDYSLRPARDGSGYELVPPRCATQRTEDLQEVEHMIAAGEFEIARDELRWLIQECPHLMEAHQMLGELAAAEDDFALARAHFGHVFQTARNVIQRAGWPGRVPYALCGNRPLHECGKGLAYALRQQGERQLVREVVETLLQLDPDDPLHVRELLE
jgi:hypothetical protein